MAKTINDPVLGELTYDDVKQAWTRKSSLCIWGVDDYQIDLVVMCGEEEEITDAQREAYKSYSANLSNIEKEVPNVLFSYYKDHYEDFDRSILLPSNLTIDAVSVDETLSHFNISQLFINRNGDYGWKSDLITSDLLMSIVFSDDKIRIFKGWTVLNEYARIEDDVFGEMFFDQGWKKWIKKNYNYKRDGEWLMVEADAESGKMITAEQKSNYQKYLQNEKSFLEEVPHALLDYYLQNYEAIEEMCDIPEEINKNNVCLRKFKCFVRYQRLYFNRDGVRYGWLCNCYWDKEGLAIYYDGKHDGICVGSIEDLVM